MYAQPLPDNSGRARTAGVMMTLTLIVFSLLSVISILKFVATDWFEDNYTIAVMGEGLVGLLQLVIQILTIVFFIMWFRRAYNNLYICQVRGLPYSEGWAAGGWFVPIISLYYPYHIMNAIWEQTPRALRKQGEHVEPREDGNIGWWWAFWITGSIIGNIQAQLTIRGIYGDFETSMLGMELFSNVALTVAAYLGLQMIRKTAETESELRTRHAEWLLWHTQQRAQQYQQAQAPIQ